MTAAACYTASSDSAPEQSIVKALETQMLSRPARWLLSMQRTSTAHNGDLQVHHRRCCEPLVIRS